MKTKSFFKRELIPGLLIICLAFLFAEGGCGSSGGSEGSGSSSGGSPSQSEGKITQDTAEDVAFNVYNTGKQSLSFTSRSGARSGPGSVPPAVDVSRILAGSIQSVLPSTAAKVTLPTVYSDSGTIQGTCGGSAEYSIEVEQVTKTFAGTMTYYNYCYADNILSGTVTYSGTINEGVGQGMSFEMVFTALTSSGDGYSFTMAGVVSADVVGTTTTTQADMTLTDNTTGDIYKLEDYLAVTTAGSSSMEYTMTGTVHLPDYGAFSVSTPTKFIYDYGAPGPKQGVMIAVGADNRSVRLTCVDAASYTVEADLNGDGSYDWKSDVQYW